MSERVIQNLHEAAGNRDETIRLLADEAQIVTDQVNQKFSGRLKFHLAFYDSPYIEREGWILDIRQLDEEYSMPDDPYLDNVAKLEISELAVNGGRVKATFYQWLEEGRGIEDTSGFGRSLSLEPVKVVEYLQAVLDTGEARPQIVEQKQGPREG